MVNSRVWDIVKLVYGTAGGYVGYDTGEDGLICATTPVLVS